MEGTCRKFVLFALCCGLHAATWSSLLHPELAIFAVGFVGPIAHFVGDMVGSHTFFIAFMRLLLYVYFSGGSYLRAPVGCLDEGEWRKPNQF